MAVQNIVEMGDVRAGSFLQLPDILTGMISGMSSKNISDQGQNSSDAGDIVF